MRPEEITKDHKRPQNEDQTKPDETTRDQKRPEETTIDQNIPEQTRKYHKYLTGTPHQNCETNSHGFRFTLSKDHVFRLTVCVLSHFFATILFGEFRIARTLASRALRQALRSFAFHSSDSWVVL